MKYNNNIMVLNDKTLHTKNDSVRSLAYISKDILFYYFIILLSNSFFLLVIRLAELIFPKSKFHPLCKNYCLFTILSNLLTVTYTIINCL